MSQKIYVDVAEGSGRVGGNAALYQRLLGSFVKGDYFGLIEKDIENGDLDAAAKSAHTLKGVAANLSLKEVNILAAQLEQELKNGLEYSATLEELKQANEITLSEINSL